MPKLARWAGIVALVAAVAGTVGVRAQQWDQAYTAGVRAVAQRDWANAIKLLEVAKRGGPAPGRRVLFTGDKVDTFNPDYYLGLAYNATGRFADAEVAFARVTAAGLLRTGDREYPDLQRQTEIARYERGMIEGERALRAGRFADAEKAVGGLIGSTMDDGRAGDIVQRSKAGEATRTATGPAYGNAPPTATTPPANPPANVVPPTGNPTVPPLENRTNNSGLGADAKANVAVAEATREPAGTTKEASSKAPPAAPTNVRVIPDPPVVQNPPPQMTDAEAALAGSAAFFGGNYAAAIRILQPAFDMAPPEHRVVFYLACSHAALVLSGQADPAALDEARKMFAYVEGGGPQFDADRQFVSPKVLRTLAGGETAR